MTLQSRLVSGTYTSCSYWPGCVDRARSTRYRQTRRYGRQAVERDVSWDTINVPAKAPSRNNPGPPPPPPPPPPPTRSDYTNAVPDGPFKSRRDLILTMVGGTAAYWLLMKKVGQPVEFADQPDIPFRLLGYTDVNPDDFVYFKTPGGNWVGAALDEQKRLYMIDEVGDLYFDSGDPEIGLYAMDTEGNLFNFYKDVDGQRKITPVGNISDLKKFKISEVAGVKLDKDVNVVAFQDEKSIALPPDVTDLPGEIVEGINMPRENPFARLFGDYSTRSFPLDRYEVDLNDPESYERQLFDQVLLDDPDLPGFQPALPEGFSLEDLAKEVEEESKRKRR